MLMRYSNILRVLRDRISTRQMTVSRQENEYHLEKYQRKYIIYSASFL